MAARVIHWDGKNLPDGLQGLAPGTYVLESLEDVPQLTREEDEGLRRALDSLDRGEGIPLSQVMMDIRNRDG